MTISDVPSVVFTRFGENGVPLARLRFAMRVRESSAPRGPHDKS